MPVNAASPAPPPDRFWAKLDRGDDATGTDAGWHPLVAHSADVAAVMDRLLRPDSPLADRLAAAAGLPALSPPDRAALVYLAALHDMGKANHGFQARARPAELRRWGPEGHVTVLLRSLRFRPLTDVIGTLLHPLGLDNDTAQELFFTVISHHGRPWGGLEPSRRLHRLWQPAEPRDPLAEIRRLGRLARRWSGLDAARPAAGLRVTPAFTHVYAGALTLADWIGSTPAAFPFDPAADDAPEDYWERARARADRACREIGVVPAGSVVSLQGLSLLEEIFPDLFPKHDPTPLQRHVAEMPLPVPGSRLLIESDTGSGKTEAALTLYARLRAAGRVGGLLFALPTRATATAMHERVTAALEKLYPADARPTVALAIGGPEPRAEVSAEILRGEAVQHPDAEDRELVHWATSSTKKFFAAEVVVGTIDQVLLGGLPVKHAHLRLAALSRHLLVVDELHSYDRYMAEVLARVLDAHGAAGGVALFMSATLSEVERRRFGGLPGEPPPRRDAVRRPYPVLSICERPGAGWDDHALPAIGGAAAREKTIEWDRIRPDQAAGRAVAAARAGARVCVLRNTVAEARATVEAIREAGGADLLWRPDDAGAEHTPAYHSRYIPPDRTALDTAVLRRFGRNGPGGGVILVATQVVEQSLDVDFDLFITDLCPVDALLQRLGRLHRHPERGRPDGFDTARALVLAPAGGLGPYVAKERGPCGWGTVYTNLADLQLTFRTIGERPRVSIPADNRLLIERVYHPDAREMLRDEPAWATYLDKAEGAELGMEIHARQTALLFEGTYIDAARRFDMAPEQKIRTRLGDDRIRFELPNPVEAWYAPDADPVHTVDLPEWLLPDEAPEGEALMLDPRDGPNQFRLGDWTVEYTPQGWRWTRG